MDIFENINHAISSGATIYFTDISMISERNALVITRCLAANDLTLKTGSHPKMKDVFYKKSEDLFMPISKRAV